MGMRSKRGALIQKERETQTEQEKWIQIRARENDVNFRGKTPKSEQGRWNQSHNAYLLHWANNIQRRHQRWHHAQAKEQSDQSSELEEKGHRLKDWTALAEIYYR